MLLLYPKEFVHSDVKGRVDSLKRGVSGCLKRVTNYSTKFFLVAEFSHWCEMWLGPVLHFQAFSILEIQRFQTI